MKTLTFLFLASLLVINNLFAQTPPESPELKQATILTEEAVKLFKERKYDDALSRAKRALEIREKLLPQTDPRIATSLNYIGDLYLVKKHLKAAAPVYERLLEIQSQQFGPENIKLATTLERLGIVYRAEQDFDRSADHYKRALSIYGRVSGIKDPEFERASDGLTCLYYESGNRQLMKELNEIRAQFATPSEAPGKVERHILDGKALKLPKPKYSIGARERRVSGIVVVKLEIGEDGKVISATDMCQGHPDLVKSALESARDSLFEPVKINGQPAKVKGVIRYKFVAQ